MQAITNALTGLSESIFLALVGSPVLILLTGALAVAIWVLPNRLLKDQTGHQDTKG